MTYQVVRAAERYRTEQPGIISYHSLSAGPHYDPGNLSFGALTGYDEHLLSPGAGFALHPHRAVDIVTWVLDGALTHQDSLGNQAILESGAVAVLHAGASVSHEERNDGDISVRFVQATALAARSAPTYARVQPPVRIGSSTFDTMRAGEAELVLSDTQLLHVFVAHGEVVVAQVGELVAGDALRATGPARVGVSVKPDALALLWGYCGGITL